MINGFYMSMRGKFTKPPAEIQYYTVEWPAASLGWEAFRGTLLGPTDPKDGPVGSLRREIYDNYKSLGLAAKPDTGDNGVHASASPFEALAERMNWLGVKAEDDTFGKGLAAVGISGAKLAAWSEDPQLPFEGQTLSLFDMLEVGSLARPLEREEVDRSV